MTACDPDGRPLDAESNRQRDAQLAAILKQEGFAFWRTTGGSADFLHAEPGYAIQTPMERALAIARAFRQEAIFWVELGELFLVNCADGEKHLLGLWTDRQDPATSVPQSQVARSIPLA